MKAFSCPQCAAVLEFELIEKSWVRCTYCNSLVVVPAELRPPLPEPPRGPQTTFGGGPPPKKVALGIVAVALAALAVVLGVIFANSRSSNEKDSPRVATSITPWRFPTPTPAPTPNPEGYAVAYTFGGEGTGPGLFKDELGVAVDDDGRVYVSDETRRVQRFDPSGQFLNTWSIPTETKWYRKLRGGPSKIIANERDEIYAVLAGVILKLEGETGEVLGAAHGSDYIHDAALSQGRGLLVVSQKGDDDELVLIGGDKRAAWRTHRFVSAQLDKKLEVRALRVAAGPGGEIYSLYCIGGVAGEHWYDDEDIAVFRFSPDAKYVGRFGGQGRERGQYGPPAAIAADNNGRVYVVEPFDRVHVYEPDGRHVRTLKAPHGVNALTFDAQNNLYVAGNHKVSKLILDR